MFSSLSNFVLMSLSLWHMLQSYCETSNFLKCLKNSRWAWHEKAKHHHLGLVPKEMYIAHIKKKKKRKRKMVNKKKQTFLFISKIIHTLNWESCTLLDCHLDNPCSCSSVMLGAWLVPRPWQGGVSAALGKQQELQSLTQAAQHAEQNGSLMCDCCCCCKLRTSAAPSPDLPLKAHI